MFTRILRCFSRLYWFLYVGEWDTGRPCDVCGWAAERDGRLKVYRDPLGRWFCAECWPHPGPGP